MSDRKVGVVRSWNQTRGFGILRVGPESSLELYFAHINQVRSGTATPSVGMEVYFQVDERSVGIDGKLPKAIRIDFIVPEEAEDGGSN
jgi:cold shock CspA family protein